ncbi:hypothetical protein K491DRAFT_318144 [Lophiostoma macrostomum CBS 122681]|uniref:RNA-dependent RNA polymerase n=1 Tax=Lophiostoma macrostomum CBS 122681 TaxID=1314788 RepID=A0A6A6TG55_9PLEO|nr:hypothetical protein K491DRAFT_318144 [Lophiostoma macrostomum CBS 122681]
MSNPRLAPPTSDYGTGPVIPARPRTGAALNELIRQLNVEHQFSLPVRDETWSPRRNTKSSTLAGKIFGQIKHLYFSAEPALRRVLDDFKAQAGRLQHDERLNQLHQLLKSQSSSPSVRGTGSRTPRDDPHKSLRPQTPDQSVRPPRGFSSIQHDEPESHYTTAPESGSPTDEDTDEEYITPPSPTPSTRSGRMGSQGKHPAGSFSPVAAIPPPIFKKPSLDMARSYKAESTQTSFNTSFNSNSVWSSQRSGTQSETMATSFNSDVDEHRQDFPRLTRTSSTTIGSLDDQDFVEVTSRLEKEQIRISDASTSRSSSNFGSVDTDAFRFAAIEAEAMRNHTLIDKQETYQATDRSPPPVRTPPRRLLSTNVPGVAPPSRTAAELPKRVDLNESPSKTTYYVREIPSRNLFVEDISDNLRHFPYFILFMCLRISIENKTSLLELMEGMDAAAVKSDSQVFWAFIHGHPEIRQGPSQEATGIWSAAKNKCEGFMFKGIVTFNTHRYGPIFRLTLLPPQPDNACRFERAFGADRFLYLTFPSFESGDKSPRFDRNYVKGEVRDRWKEWLQAEHSFLGRKWHAFHLEPLKKPKGGRSNRNESYGYRVVLFATEGIGINNACSVGEMLNWFFPFAKNQEQSICKAFARVDLGLSRTVPTLAFEPSQVKYIEDTYADGTLEDVRFNDLGLAWPESDKEEDEDENENGCKGRVMNDGCSLVSYDAAREIWRLYKEKTGITTPMPSAFQARIGGAKGMWMVSPDSNSHYTRPPDFWIKISKSQLKFEPHREDESTKTHDSRRLTFEVVRFSSGPSQSDLHLSFIQILVDRGVPLEAIEQTIIRRLDLERAELLKILMDPAQVYAWVHKQGLGTQDSQNKPRQAAFPLALGDRIKIMLESGFSPTAEPYLGQCLRRIIKQQQLFEEQKLRIPLGKSTILFGIADPLGILAPGEVHCQFSSKFVDDMTDTMYTCLDDMEILVARQPACRRSDLQKVRAISHPKLGHLSDVVVFSSRGQFPLAGKLQGGDYDGDTFWICWERELVQPFQNAPAPTKTPKPSDYRISQYAKKLKEVIVPDELNSVKAFLKDAMDFRTGPDLLGKVTNYLEKQSYAENRIYSSTLDNLCDMHDLLVDAPKQGYMFTDRDFNIFKREKRLPQNPEDPAYKRAMLACINAKEMGEADLIYEKDWSPNFDNPIDYLYFNVVRKHHVETQLLVAKMLPKEKADDADLQKPYLIECKKDNPAIHKELNKLRSRLELVVREWNRGMQKSGNADQYNATVDRCYRIFRDHVPDEVQPPEVKVWFDPPYLSRGFTQWEIIRASALYTEYPQKAALIFHMAGYPLAYLKSPPLHGSHIVCNSIHSILKPKITRTPTRIEDSDSDDDEFGTPAEGFSLSTPQKEQDHTTF